MWKAKISLTNRVPFADGSGFFRQRQIWDVVVSNANVLNSHMQSSFWLVLLLYSRRIVSSNVRSPPVLRQAKPGDINVSVKTRKKGSQETAKNCKSLGIPYFKPISVLFYLFRDRRHTVSTWPETPILIIMFRARASKLRSRTTE